MQKQFQQNRACNVSQLSSRMNSNGARLHNIPHMAFRQRRSKSSKSKDQTHKGNETHNSAHLSFIRQPGLVIAIVFFP